MADIRHQVAIQADNTQVYHALSTIDGLASWWTTTTTGDTALGETIEFRFGEHLTTMQVESLEPEERVTWRCTGTNPQWLDTVVSFDLSERNEKTVVSFHHGEWREASDFFAVCSTKWATFLLSLKQFVETGEGRPFPKDMPI